MVKIRVWLVNKIADKHYVDGELTKTSFDILKDFGCSTLTLGKITINSNQIVGWEEK